MMIEILQSSWTKFVDVLPILVIAVLISQIVSVYLHKDKIKKHFHNCEKDIVKAALCGIATPGPLIAFMPLLKVLKKKGLPIALIVAFMTAQVLIGPMRFFLEVKYFGIVFFVSRLVLSILLAIAVATVFRFIVKLVKFK